MKTKDNASKVIESIEDFRHHVAQGLGPARGVLLNLVDVLAVGPRPASPVELALSPLWGYDWSSLYTGINRAGQQLADTIADDDWLVQLRQARLDWLATQTLASPHPQTGDWGVRILDGSDYPRPKTRTVPLGYVHSAEGMVIGHGLSLLSERVGEGSWTLPLEIAWIPPQTHPLTYGVVQIEQFVKRQGLAAGGCSGGGCAIHGRALSVAGSRSRSSDPGPSGEQPLFLFAAAAVSGLWPATSAWPQNQTQRRADAAWD